MKTNLKVVAYCGIALLAISLLYAIFQPYVFTEETLVSEIISNLFFIILTVLSLVIYFGYLALSNKYNVKFLKIMTWIGIVFDVVFLVLMLLSLLFVGMPQASAEALPDLSDIPTLDDIPAAQVAAPELAITEEEAMAYVVSLIVFYVIFSLVLGAYYVLFGFSLLRLKDKVPYSKSTAILYIVSGFTFIIVVGFFVAIAAKVLEIIMFFRASEKLEKKKVVSRVRKKK